MPSKPVTFNSSRHAVQEYHVTFDITDQRTGVGEVEDPSQPEADVPGAEWKCRIDRDGWVDRINFEICSPDKYFPPPLRHLLVTVTQHHEAAVDVAPHTTFPVIAIDMGLENTESGKRPSIKFHIDTSYPILLRARLIFTVVVLCPDKSNDDDDPDLSEMSGGTDLAVRSFLHDSMHSAPTFIDTKFYVFSRRTSTRVDRPRALFGNSGLLKDSSVYLADLLGENGFSESKLTALEGSFPSHEQPYTEEYDYWSDSDLDSEEDFEEPKSEDALSSEVSSSIAATKEGKRDDDESQVFRGLTGKTIVVKDIAYITWQALIYYLYTGVVVFAPLSYLNGVKVVHRAEFIAKYASENPKMPLPCSAKSMYRLADKIDLPALKSLAFDYLKKQLSEKTILHETFSKFTSRYPDILEAELNLLRNKFARLKNTADLKYHIEYVMKEDSIRAIPIVMSLIGI